MSKRKLSIWPVNAWACFLVMMPWPAARVSQSQPESARVNGRAPRSCRNYAQDLGPSDAGGLHAGLGDEGVSEHKGGHFLRSRMRGMTVEQGSLPHVDLKLLIHHLLLPAFGIEGEKLIQEGTDAIAPVGNEQGFCG